MSRLRNMALIVLAMATALVASSFADVAQARHRIHRYNTASNSHHARHHAYRSNRHAHYAVRHLRAPRGGRVHAEIVPSTGNFYASVDPGSAVQFTLADARARETTTPNYSARLAATALRDTDSFSVTAESYTNASRLIRVAESYLGTNPTGMRRQWCRAFVNLVARRAGYRINGSLMARAPTGGVRISHPVPGAVAQNWRHTGFVKAVSADGRRFLMVSGNSGGRGPGRRTTTENWRSTRAFQYAMLR